ncbi:GGDEF domain-containing protein [Paenibacillus sp. MBLB4367]|uniref:GGDEF domain-containing protein n=1 Tax=Paenibacillus sp. MBLB4367 TaxID=3384767 RepID=UPI003908299F
MNGIETHPVGIQHWNRKILNVYWAVTVIYMIANALSISYQYWKGLQTVSLAEMIWLWFALPLAGMVLCLIFTETASRLRYGWSVHVVIVAGTALAGIIVAFHAQMNGIQLVFLMPMFVSVFYFQRRKVAISFACNLVVFFLLLLLHTDLMERLDGDDIVFTVAVLMAGLVIAYGILSRGIEMQKHLKKTVEAQQDLLVKNVMMDKLSKTDALTDLYNHKTFHEYLDKLIEHAEKNGLSLQLAIIDIDSFKKVNDTYGHWIGDIILRRVAAAIREHIATDDFGARYGGEEFAVIFTDKALEQAFQIVEVIRHTIEQMEHEELDGKSVTISIGLQAYRRGTGKEFLFKGTDASLYTAKRTGKNRTVVGQPAEAIG